MDKFVNLHVHSDYSPDSIGKVSELIKQIKSFNQKALAITDHSTLGSYIELFEAAKENKIKPIFGNEIYLDYQGKIYHATILAKNKIGYRNIILMNNEAHKNVVIKGKDNKFPVTTIDMLEHFAEGLIALTGCPSSAFYRNSNFNINSYDKSSLVDSLEYVKLLTKLFGADNCYYELMFSMDQSHYQVVFDANKQIKLPIVYTSDSHFITKEQSSIHQATVWMKKGYSYESSSLYLKTREEARNHILSAISTTQNDMLDSFNIDSNINEYKEELENADEYLDNTVKLAETIEAYDIKEKPTLPKIKKSEIDEFVKYLENQLDLKLEEFNYLFNKLVDKYNINLNQNKIDEFFNKTREQFSFELKILTELKFLDYFYINNDLIQFCNKNNIFIRARGSGGGSIITWLMGVMPVNPLLFDLKFGRFINYERKDYPDLDLDVEPNRRKEIFAYMKEKWGMIGVTTYNMCSHKTIIHDVCRYFREVLNIEIPKDLENNAVDYDEETGAFKKEFDTFLAFDGRIKLIYDSMIDTIRHRGKHAAAIASPQTIAPIECWGEIPTLAWSESGAGKKELSAAGLVKIDILGVDALDKIRKSQILTGVNFNYYEHDLSWLKQFTDSELPISPIFDLFKKGETTGLFQFLSNVAIRLAKDVKPESLDDLSAVIALNRPNMLEAGLSFEYSKFKTNPRLLHPKIDEALSSSYGTLLYQENMMTMYSIVTGQGDAAADSARKVLSPKHFSVIETQEWKDKAEELHKIFLENGITNGFSQELLDHLWNEILKFGRYGFNKSHSIVYAYNALEQAFYKYYYPNEYYVGLLNYTKYNEKGRDDIQNYLWEMANNGLKVVKPNLQYSDPTEFVYSKDEGKIFLPLESIKGIGATVSNAICEKRPFSSLEDFMNKFPSTTMKKKAKKDKDNKEEIEKHPVNIGVRQKLYQAGVFKGIEGNIRSLELKDENVKVNTYDIFGFHLINKKLADYIKAKNEEGYVCGFISEIIDKTASNGKPYRLYRVFPKGYIMAFSEHLLKTIELNQLFYAVVDSQYKSIKQYNLVEYS